MRRPDVRTVARLPGFFDTRAFTDNPRWSGCYCYFPIHDPNTCVWPQRTSARNREAICGAVKTRQAKPRKDANTQAENHLGPLSMYLAVGFQIVRETAEGDVFVRKSLLT